MVTWSQVIKKYGKDMADKMSRSPYLTGITISLNENGEADIPQRDVDLAFRDIRGEHIGNEEWD